MRAGMPMPNILSRRKEGGVALLSGGLDSTVAFFMGVKRGYIDLAITFDYGQISFKKEERSAKFFARKLKVKHITISLPFLKSLSSSSGLIKGNPREPLSLKGSEMKRNVREVWIPNRNSLFINIAASFCDAYNKRWIVAGFNREEGEVFPDNSEEFVRRINDALRLSTLVKPKVWAPLIKFRKVEILKMALKMNLSPEKMWVCYRGDSKHCGRCESCLRLKMAMKEAGVFEKYRRMFLC